MKNTANLKSKANEIIFRLRQEYPDSKCSLKFDSPFQLLVATILSAQCTDKRVNQVTENLFSKYPDVEDYIGLDVEILKKLIFSTGFYKNKSKAIVSLAKKLSENFNGTVPDTLTELVQLPGVGRKTANVVLGVAFSTPGLVVDTHVSRISRLLYLTVEKSPDKIEIDLMKIVRRKDWIDLAHLFIDHGRKVCIARRPKCTECILLDLCPSGKNLIHIGTS